MISDFLKEKLQKEYCENILMDCDVSRCTTFRVNKLKTNMHNVEETLQNLNISYDKVSWDENALVLNENMEKTIQGLDMYKNGEIYLQSLSSMLPPIVLNPKPKENILDMCAAPGSKTTQIAAISENKAYITACERNKVRAERLKHNIEMQGCRGTTVIVRDARDLDDFLKFDKILLDAPCSGSGTESASKIFTKDLIQKCVKTQSALLNKAIKLLKSGGQLVYSTCSILREENEEQIYKLLEKNKNLELIPLIIDNIPQLKSKIDGTILIRPDKLYEGFFIAKIKKK